MDHKVFVYGTLRDYAGVSEATHTLTGYAMYDAGKFPYITEGDVGDAVHGNILIADDTVMEDFDRYESVNTGLYVRKKASVMRISDREAVECWVYIAGPTLLPRRIASGDWRNR